MSRPPFKKRRIPKEPKKKIKMASSFPGSKEENCESEAKENIYDSDVETDREDLPEGWFRKKVVRKYGKTAGHVDVYIYSSDGVKLRSKPDIAAYLAKTKSNLKVEDFYFKKKKRSAFSKKGSIKRKFLGNVTKQENQQLLSKLKSTLKNLLNEKRVNSQEVEEIKQELNVSVISQPNLPIPVLRDVPEISYAEKDTNLNNDIDIDNKGEPCLSNNCNFDSDVEIQNDTLSLSTNCDILTSTQKMNEDQTCDSSLRKRKSGVVFDSGDIQIANTGTGSLWSQYDDSVSEWKSSVGVSIPHNANGLNIQDLLKQLGFSEAEYSTKLCMAKKLWGSIKEMFTTNGSNEFVNLSLKSDEDYIMCLLLISEYLCRFQNDNSISKHCVLPEKILYNCDSMSDVKEQKGENEEIKIRQSELVFAIEQRDTEMKKLLSELDAMQQKYQELVKTNKRFHKENKEFLQEINRLNNKYANLLNSKKKADQFYERCIRSYYVKMMDFQKRKFQAPNEKVKSEVESLKSKVISLETDRETLKREVTKLRTENMRLSSLKKKEAHAAKSNEVSYSIPIEHNSRLQYDKSQFCQQTWSLPHMQCSYSVELQSLSPFSQKLLEYTTL